MKTAHGKMSLIFGCVMGVLTILISLVVADGIFGLNQPPAKAARELVGFLFFWCGMIVLPLLFHKKLKWRDTLQNLLLYFLLYLPTYEVFGLKHTHFFLETGGFIAFPSYWGGILVAVIFWGIQSIMFLIINSVSYAMRKTKG